MTDALRRLRVIGRDGVELSAAWREEIKSYYGITVSGFPNFFMLLGPNTGLGHTSVVIMIEAQAKYIIDCLKQMRRRGLKTVEVRPDVEENFYRSIQAKLKGTIWQAGGCRSWYQDSSGRNVSIWPGFTFDYRRRTRRADLGDYLTR